MALFTRGLYDSDPSFTPLFRLLDEFDNYTREARGNNSNNNNSNNGERPRHRGRLHAGTFNPRFDVRETDHAYELHGELPGIERDKINIEFTDSQSLVIRGRTERNYTSGTTPAGLVEGGVRTADAITDKGGEHAASAESANSGQQSSGTEKNKSPFEKYWVQERSIGEFARTFNFPSRVDQDAVTASLNNGVLSLVVPKAKQHETRRIAIN